MNKRLQLIMTRPSDDGFDSYVKFRQKTSLKSRHNQRVLTKDELIAEWEKFWEFLKIEMKNMNDQVIKVN